MSRFEHLEFDAPLEGLNPRAHPRLTDAARCLEEAGTAFGRADFESSLRWFGRVLEFDPHNLSAWAIASECGCELAEILSR